MSWNSSTIRWSKRSRQALARRGLDSSSSSARSSRSWKSSAERSSLSALVARVKALEQQLERAPRGPGGLQLLRRQRALLLAAPRRVDGSGTPGSRGSAIPWLRSRVWASSVIGADARGDRRPRRATSSSPAASSSSSASRAARSASRAASVASRTRKRGSRPAASGCVASSRRQKAWIVEHPGALGRPRGRRSSSARASSPAARSARARRSARGARGCASRPRRAR